MLAPLTQGGGAEKYFIDLARNISGRGFEVDVITMDEAFFGKFGRLLHVLVCGNFFRKIPVEGREKEESIKQQLGGSNWIKSSWSNLSGTLSRYDIIYAKNEIVDLLLLKMIGYKKLPPVIVGVHTPVFYPSVKSLFSKLHNFLYQSFFYKWLLKGARCLHVSNKFTKDLVDRKFDVKSRLVYYPFSAKEITKNSEENKVNIDFDKNKFNIIFSGRLSEQKGVAPLANIIAAIGKRREVAKKIAVNIFGKGDEKSEKIILDLKKKYDFVQYYGHMENKFMPSILNQQSLLISTSLWETLPYNILEAQALGLPVVAFDIPGPSDIVEKKTGFLVESEEEFAEKMISIVMGDVTFERREIIENVEKKFNPDKIYADLLNMFEENL